MAGYNVVKTQRALPIGSVQPWGGDLSEIPDGWLLCNAQELNANDYPLLARVLRDTYGGQNFTGIFPNYNGTFRLPVTNDKALADISTTYFGLYAGSNTVAWAADKTVYNGDIILSAGKYYTVILTDAEAVSGKLGPSAPTHTAGTQPNGDEVNLTYQIINTGTSGPPNEIDNPEAFALVKDFLGDSIGGFEPGDLSPPNVQVARTDINLTYTPDPQGTAVATTFVGTAPSVAETTVETITAADIVNGSNNSTSAVVTGTGLALTVVLNINGTYNVGIKAKGEGYNPGDVVTVPGTKFTNGSTPANDLVVTITQTGNSLFEGTITGQSLIKGFGIKDVYIIPRKMGRGHLPQHYHEGTYRTTNYNDSKERPGLGVTIWSTPDFTFMDTFKRRNPCPPEQNPFGLNMLEINCPIPGVQFKLTCDPGGTGVTIGGIDPGDPKIDSLNSSPWSAGKGRFSIGVVGGGLPLKGYIPGATHEAAHGIGKTWFNTNTVKNLRTADGTTTIGQGGNGNPNGTDAQKLQALKATGYMFPGYRIPFSDSAQTINVPNYFDGTNDIETHGPFEVLFNHPAVDFKNDTIGTGGANDIIETHDHDGTFAVVYDGTALDIPEQIQVECQPNVIPENITDALQITFTTRVASLTVTNLIRAY